MKGKDVEITGGPIEANGWPCNSDREERFTAVFALDPECEGFMNCGRASCCAVVYSGIDVMTGNTVRYGAVEPIYLCEKCAKLVQEYDGAILSFGGMPCTNPLGYDRRALLRVRVRRFLEEFARAIGLYRLLGVK